MIRNGNDREMRDNKGPMVANFKCVEMFVDFISVTLDGREHSADGRLGRYVGKLDLNLIVCSEGIKAYRAEHRIWVLTRCAIYEQMNHVMRAMVDADYHL